MKNKKTVINEKSLKVLSCAVAVAVMILLLSGDMIISRFIRVNPNQEYHEEPKKSENNSEEQPVENQADTNYDVSFMAEDTLRGVLQKIQNKETFFVFSGRSTCGPCRMFVPILRQAYQDYNITDGLYINRSLIRDTTDGYSEFVALSSVIEENFGSTPFFMIFEQGVLKDYVLGMAADETMMLSILEEKLEMYRK